MEERHAIDLRPLVTLVLVAYNQERYVRQAVAGAFAQDYTPLEIILSDDASCDATFEIMREMAAAYAGPHQLVLNRNTHNMGVCAHLSKCVAMASGVFIVGAAGDDISLGARVTELVRAWQAAGGRVLSLFSNSEIIDEAGESRGLAFEELPAYTRNLSEFSRNGRSWVTGCSHAFSKELFTDYGDLDPRILQEDGALSFRALLNGQIQYIDKVLVKYRQHDHNTYSIKDAEKIARLKRHEYFLRRGRLRDARKSECKDHHLLRLLRWACVRAYANRVFHSIPVVGPAAWELRLRIGRMVRRRRA
jgi:glycosyltransferase involved in cell wall biosynthesis